jgi:hypothetical protein
MGLPNMLHPALALAALLALLACGPALLATAVAWLGTLPTPALLAMPALVSAALATLLTR